MRGEQIHPAVPIQVPPSIVGRVFIVQQNPNLDYSDARRFGLLVPMIRRDLYPDDGTPRTRIVREALAEKLAAYNPEMDYLLLTGDPVAIFLAGSLLREITYRVRVLKYDKENRRYFPVVVDL